MGSGRSGQTPSPRNRIQIHLGKENEGSWRDERRGRGGEGITQSNRRTTYTLGCCWGRSGGKAPVGRRAAQHPCQLSSQGRQGVQSQWGSAGTFHERWSSQEQTHLSREKLTQLFGPLGETNHWQILEKHLLKSLMP